MYIHSTAVILLQFLGISSMPLVRVAHEPSRPPYGR